MQLARAVAIEFDHRFRRHVMPYPVDRGIPVVPVIGVARDLDIRPDLPGIELVRTVRHEIAGACVLVAVHFDRGPVHREHARMGEHADEVRGGSRQRDSKLVDINGFDAQRMRWHFPADYLLRVDYRRNRLRIERGRRRVDEPAVTVDEVPGRHRISIRPAGIRS